MGNWTEFKLSVALDIDVPREVLKEIGNHEGRFGHVLIGSSYMCNNGKSIFDLDSDTHCEMWTLNVNSFIKGMKYNDVSEFLKYISPHVVNVTDFAGYVYYDGYDTPSLIMMDDDDNTLKIFKITGLDGRKGLVYE